MAEAIGAWLPQVIQVIEPWFSPDIEKGSRWTFELAAGLEQTQVGIICLTSENRQAPWLIFEAGALSKMRHDLVCTLLLDLKPVDVEPPLDWFQHTEVTQDDVRRLIDAINGAVGRAGEKAVADGLLGRVYQKLWPELESTLLSLRSETAPAGSVRTSRELIEEIVEHVRGLRALPSPEGVGSAYYLRTAYEGPAGIDLAKVKAELGQINGVLGCYGKHGASPLVVVCSQNAPEETIRKLLVSHGYLAPAERVEGWPA